MKSRQLIVVVLAVSIIGGSAALAAFFASQKAPPEEKELTVSVRYVKTAPVEYSDVETSVVAFGRVETAQSLDLLSEVGGRMYEGKIRLKAGQNFRKGTLLFYIDDDEAALNLKSQKSNFLRDLAAILPDLKIDFSDSYDNWQEYFSKVDIDNALPELPENSDEKEKTFLATKGIYSSYYSIKSAESRLKKHRYYAPFDGSISEVAMETGAFVNPGTKIGKIIRAGAHELKVSVETRDISWIQEGAEVKIFSDETQQYWDGKVLRISDFVNQNTQSVDVFLAIQSNGQRLYDGQFLQAAIPARTIKDGMIMPRSAIYNRSEVFVLEDTLLKVKKINVVRLEQESAIFTGLEEGEALVVEPLINAHNNMVAKKLEEKEIDLERKTDAQGRLVSGSAGN
ncbi:MAG: efflux RND transporter periplasmic adaptor subunit [Cytophagales bacterium]|nr:efflux RND transporter periplasmic adaptor subunit [Cytophagales bacterium]